MKKSNTIITNAIDWVMESGIQNRGNDLSINGSYNAWYRSDTGKYSYVYSEITGYLTTLMCYLFERRKDEKYLINAKIAGDCLLMMQTEVGEVQESFPGESSAMPHKKNPVHALVPVAALPLVATHLATLAGSQMHAHEREPGSWHTEWITLPVLTCLTLASVERVKEMISGLKINISQMRANLALTRGTLAAEELVTTLAVGIARDEAHNLVNDLLKQSQNNNFSETVRSNSRVSELLTKEKIAEILGYKQTLTAATREAQRLAKTINDV